MKTSILTLAAILTTGPALAAVFPASTNGNNTFFGINTFTRPTILSGTVSGNTTFSNAGLNTILINLKGDVGVGGITGTLTCSPGGVALGTVGGTLLIDGFGVLNGNGAGLTQLTGANVSGAVAEATFVISPILTNKVYHTNAITVTNSVAQIIDFGIDTSYREGIFHTNAAFAWLGFTNVSFTLSQTVVVWLTNDTGVPIDFTAPANCHTKGILNCTNVSELVFKCYGNKWTNLFSLPLW